MFKLKESLGAFAEDILIKANVQQLAVLIISKKIIVKTVDGHISILASFPQVKIIVKRALSKERDNEK